MVFLFPNSNYLKMIRYAVVVCLLLFICEVFPNNTDYCQLSCGSKKNTACKGKNEKCGPGPACKNFKVIPVKKDLILRLHNEYRNKVATGNEKRNNQPSASNMRALTYDSDLEYVAQCLANTCTFGHDSCRRTKYFQSVGQNIAIYSTTGKSVNIDSIITNMVGDWYNEVQHFRSDNVKHFGKTSGPVVGHYTQMVWADTSKIGCGMTSYTSGKWNNYLMVCNYGPGGNVIGRPIYKIGKPASECPGGSKNKQYHGLC